MLEINSEFIRQSILALHKAVGAGPFALHEPKFSGNEWECLKHCLNSTFVSSVGEYVNRFEAEIAAYTGAKYAIAVMNGTAALHTTLLLGGVMQGDEVLVPAMTFIATANAVSYCNAIPHFVDIEEDSFGVDPVALRAYLETHTEQYSGRCVNKSTRRIVRALVIMHTFGHPGRIDELLAIARDFRLILIEDAAESLGSFYFGRHTGTFGLMGVLSFNGNKIITTGGGGAIITNNSELAIRAKHITTTAKLPHPWLYLHDEIGFNYRMPNLNAALGCAQIEQLPKFIEAKRMLFSRYSSAFSEVRGLQVVKEPSGCLSNYWLQTVLLDRETMSQRDALLNAFNNAGFMSRPVWTLMHQLDPYRECPRMELGAAENLAERLINIPSSASLGEGNFE